VVLLVSPQIKLIKRISAGYEKDLFVFKVGRNTVKRHYGRWYDDEQAVNLLLKEMGQSES
jgi:hypothetical protein